MTGLIRNLLGGKSGNVRAMPWSIVKLFVKPGDRVAELYHGEKTDILLGLAQLVGKRGVVFGIDQYNPEVVKGKLPVNIRLLQAKLPNVPSGVRGLDAIIIREPVWLLYDQGKPLPDRYKIAQAIYSLLKASGYFIIRDPGGFSGCEIILYTNLVLDLYQGRLIRVYPEKEIRHADLLVFQKP